MRAFAKPVHLATSPYTLPIAAVVAGIGLRVFLAAAYYGNYDQWSYEIVTSIMQRRENVYAVTDRYNYSPLWAFLLLSLSKITQITHLDFHLVIRSFLICIDTFNAVLIGLIAHQTGHRAWQAGFAVYLLNPVAILLIGYHGQFETLASLPLLLATYLISLRPEDPPRRYIWLLGSAALIINHNVIFSVWMLFVYAFRTPGHALLSLFVSVLLFSATFIPYLPEGGAGILRNVVSYRAQTDVYGMGDLLPPEIAMPLFVGAMLALPFVARGYLRLQVVEGMGLAGVALISLIPGIAEQYFIVPVLFGTVAAGRPYLFYSGLATLFLLGSANNLHIPFVPSLWNAVWLAAVAWLATYFLRLKRRVDVSDPCS